MLLTQAYSQQNLENVVQIWKKNLVGGIDSFYKFFINSAVRYLVLQYFKFRA